ncbi:MAG TPA: sigma-70 family RNA polymerase sigma factor [Rhodospirillales bacterium]|nr:sigma-70 family RNA polymerase sigma factor [Rhodospirillales bacterium]
MRPVPDDDVELRAIQGDTTALTTLLERVGPLVRAELSGRIPDKWRSVLSEDDLMQQTYADALRGIGRFTPLGRGAFRAWLSSLARCNLTDALRMLGREKRGGSRQRVHHVRGEDSVLDLIDLLSGSTTSPSGYAEREEIIAAVTDALTHLPEAYREVVTLYDLRGLPADEVGRLMGRSRGAIYMLRARSHDRLRERLGVAGVFLTDHA